MRIAFSMDGGLASLPGLRRPVAFDCERLSPERAARLRALVERARFFTAPAGAAVSGAPDARSYTVEIEDGRQCRTMTIPEPIADAKLRELVAEIRDCARTLRSG